MSKVYFITGGSSGFGEALAKAVLERGDCAVLGARRTDALERIAAPYPHTAVAVALDITDAGARRRAVGAALERFGRVDVLANIAGQARLARPRNSRPRSSAIRWSSTSSPPQR